MHKLSMFKDILSDINTEQEQEEFLIQNGSNPEICFWLAKLYAYKFSNEFITKLSEIVLNSNDERFYYNFYFNINFDKSNYESYFRNLIFK